MLVASIFIGPATAVPERRLAWGAMLVLVGAAAGSAVWFIFVQKWILGAFCPYCMATHTIGVLLAGLVIWRAQVEEDATRAASLDSLSAQEVTAATEAVHNATNCAVTAAPVRKQFSASSRRVIGLLPAIGLPALGLALAGGLAAFQFGLTPRGMYRSGESQDNLTRINPHAVPLVGSPDAPYVIMLLFDYKCPHCQRVHALLNDAIRPYDGKLAFALCPAPLNTQCNPYVSRDLSEFKDSCELARIGLAVWAANRDAFFVFDRWMFSPEPGQRWRPRNLEAARAKAVELLGKAKFDAARADPWIDRYMQSSIQVFGDTIQGGNAVPKLVFGPRWVTPEPHDASDLVSILHDSLGLPRP